MSTQRFFSLTDTQGKVLFVALVVAKRRLTTCLRRSVLFYLAITYLQMKALASAGKTNQCNLFILKEKEKY